MLQDKKGVAKFNKDKRRKDKWESRFFVLVEGEDLDGDGEVGPLPCVFHCLRG